MSILLNGLSMPENTFYIQIRIYDGGFVTVDIDGEEAQVAEAIAIPSHGRLIDADALIKKVEHDTPLSAVFEKTIRRYLENAPTVIPAEEKEE